MTGLPESWQDVQIIDVLENNENGRPFQQGWSPQCESFPAPEGAWGVLKTTAIQHGEFWPHENKALPDTLEPRPQTEVKPGDVLMTCAGPRNRCGVACLVENTRSRLMMSGKMYRFRPHPEALHPKYLAYLIRRQETQLEIDRMKTVINDSGLNLTHDRFSQLRLPLPPLPEQHRIVAKIEELFSELDAGTASLTRARAQLKTYRQALLKAAFEGKLTAPWRAANPDKLESPETLLSRIRKERDARYAAALDDWQTALSEWRAGGEVGRKPGKPSRPDPLSELAASNAVLDGWPIFELRDLISVSSGQGLTSSEMSGGSHPVYGGNGITGFHDQWFLKEPNLIIGRVGAKCGVTHVTQEFAWVTDNALIVTPLVDSFDQRFFLYRLEYMNLNALGSSTGQPVISGSKIYGQEIALPTLGEQSAVADIIEALDSGCAKLSEEITTALTRIAALRQSILKKAFSGQLVPQDPADEPASALLARLAQAPAPKPRRKTKP